MVSQWKSDLDRDGFCVVKGVVPLDRATSYVDSALNWLESFQELGFKRDEPATWDAAHLPDHYVGGLFTGYCGTHEKWVWDARQEPKAIEAFEEIWNTKELVVSYDAINISLPQGPNGRRDIKPTAPWPHIDQNPAPKGRPALEFELAQGLLALSKSGPNDGGLIVMKGSHNLQKEFFAATGGPKPEQDSGERNYYTYTEKDMEWFRSKGCKQIKVESEPGDLILWESRTIHWNCAPMEDITRVVAYVCYCPRSMVSDEVIEAKKAVFEKRLATTHWPNLCVVPVELYGPPQRDGKEDIYNRHKPLKEPELTDKLLKLAGIVPY